MRRSTKQLKHRMALILVLATFHASLEGCRTPGPSAAVKEDTAGPAQRAEPKACVTLREGHAFLSSQIGESGGAAVTLDEYVGAYQQGVENYLEILQMGLDVIEVGAPAGWEEIADVEYRDAVAALASGTPEEKAAAAATLNENAQRALLFLSDTDACFAPETEGAALTASPGRARAARPKVVRTLSRKMAGVQVALHESAERNLTRRVSEGVQGFARIRDALVLKLHEVHQAELSGGRPSLFPRQTEVTIEAMRFKLLGSDTFGGNTIRGPRNADGTYTVYLPISSLMGRKHSAYMSPDERGQLQPVNDLAELSGGPIRVNFRRPGRTDERSLEDAMVTLRVRAEADGSLAVVDGDVQPIAVYQRLAVQISSVAKSTEASATARFAAFQKAIGEARSAYVRQTKAGLTLGLAFNAIFPVVATMWFSVMQKTGVPVEMLFGTFAGVAAVFSYVGYLETMGQIGRVQRGEAELPGR